jgi:Zn-dependent protease with chaperone function
VTSAGPTILALETDSAWVVILSVSLVTLLLVAFFRLFISRPGGLAAGLLYSLPLALPLIAAFSFQHGVLPEISVLQPAGSAMSRGSGSLLHLLLVADDRGRDSTLYALSGSAGPWVLLFGVLVSSFMLLRRLAGKVQVHRLVRRSRPLDCEVHGGVLQAAADIGARAGLKQTPDLLLLPPGTFGAFATGGRPKILISEDLIESLDVEELQAVIAHEMAHIKARDVQVVASAGFLRDVVAWNPFAHLAYRSLARNRELEADRRAAELTGDPLAVASGLVKMCELMKRRSFRSRAALAFFRPGGRVRRRVSALLQLSESGTASLRPATNYLPYLCAGLLAIVLSLQVGARLASGEGGSAWAIMFGSPEVTDTQRWTGFGSGAARGEQRDIKTQGLHGEPAKGVKPNRPEARKPFTDALYSLRTPQVSGWRMQMYEEARKRGAASLSVLADPRSRDYEAVPVTESGSIGLYRIREL